jgi:transcriptional regulator with XRE-family HTH domain
MRLKELREEAGVPQALLANHLEISQNTYSQYENYMRPIPVDILVKIALYFNVSADYVLGLTDMKNPYPRAERDYFDYSD